MIIINELLSGMRRAKAYRCFSCSMAVRIAIPERSITDMSPELTHLVIFRAIARGPQPISGIRLPVFNRKRLNDISKAFG